MKKIDYDQEEIKKKILPKIEKHIRNEIASIVDTVKQSGSNQTREEIYNEYLNKFYQALGANSIEQFYYTEFQNVLIAFQKNFPYKSVDHFIESTLNNAFALFGRALGWEET